MTNPAGSDRPAEVVQSMIPARRIALISPAILAHSGLSRCMARI